MKSTRNSFPSIFALFALLISMFGSVVFVTPVRAAGINVNSNEDAVEDSGSCTLREAITSANTDTASGEEDGECDAGSGADIIILSAETYTLTIGNGGEGSTDVYNNWGDLDITGPLAIIGLGAGTTIIQAGNADRIFHVSGAIVSISDVTIANGTALDGGSIFNDAFGALTITNSTLSGNSANNNGGAIFNSIGGTLNVTNSTLSGNSADGNGGGIYNYSGTLNVTNSTLSGNSAGGNGSGGAIFNSATMIVTNSALSGNTANDGGGILNNTYANLTVKNSTLSGNTASGANGVGGGIYNLGTLTVSNSTLSGNSVSGANGGGGGIYNSGMLTVSNSTFSGNSATYGGGIRSSGTLNYANTIIANSSSGGDCVNHSGTIGTKTNNLVEDGSCSATFSGDPNLGALASNGGNTQTFALLTGSPAINAGDDSACAASPIFNLDQRGVTRPQGAHCDIGAYEYDPSNDPLSYIFLPLVKR